jgi:hypothetical protein
VNYTYRSWHTVFPGIRLTCDLLPDFHIAGLGGTVKVLLMSSSVVLITVCQDALFLEYFRFGL